MRKLFPLAVLVLHMVIALGGDGQQLSSQTPNTVLDGVADIHVHQMANLGFGGAIIWGQAGGGVEGLGPIPPSMRRGHDALDGATHGSTLQVFVRTLTNAYLGDWFKHGEEGYPSFEQWPSTEIWTHQQVYKDWLFRAYVGGLRLMVMLAVNSEDAFGRGENELPVVREHVFQPVKAPGRSGNDMEALDWQIRAAYKLQQEIDDEYGGPGKGWYRIVRDPDEAGRVVSEGKLAVILGTELQHLFNCDSDRPPCKFQTIDEGLSRLEAMGVNYVFPLHHKLNQFGGPARFTPLNNGPKRDCPHNNPRYTHDCSAVGLSALGRHLIEALIAHGMFIDTDHMSLLTFDDTMEIVDQVHYPVMAGHVVPFDVAADNDHTERARTGAQLKRILDGGGILGLMLGTSFNNPSKERVPVNCRPSDGGSVEQWANALLYVEDLAGVRRNQIAISSDWNGFAGWPGPRYECAPPGETKVTYPYPLPAGLRPADVDPVSEMTKFVWPPGMRTWDFDEVGTPHIGLVPDFLQDAKLLGKNAGYPDYLEPIYMSARSVVDLWKRLRNRNDDQSLHHMRWAPQSPFETFNFPQALDASRTVEVKAGVVICRSRRGHDLGFLRNGTCELVETPATTSHDAVELPAYHDGRCLTGGEGAVTETQSACNDDAKQRWYLRPIKGDRWRFENSSSGNCLAAAPDTDSSSITEGPCETGNPRQAWYARRLGNTFELVDYYHRCVEVRDQSRKDGAEIRGASCSGASNQLWTIEALRQEDYETLYQADKGRFRWVAEPVDGPSYPYPVEVKPGSQICRASIPDLVGVVYGQRCNGRTLDGSVASTDQYETLFQAP